MYRVIRLYSNSSVRVEADDLKHQRGWYKTCKSRKRMNRDVSGSRAVLQEEEEWKKKSCPRNSRLASLEVTSRKRLQVIREKLSIFPRVARKWK